MRKTLLWISFLVSVSVVHAQLYFQANGEYRWGIGRRVLARDYYVNSTGWSPIVETCGSLGGGVRFGASLGYRFCGHAAFELNYSRLDGSDINSAFTDTIDMPYASFTGMRTYSATSNSLIPTAVITYGADKFRMILSTGLNIGFGNEVVSDFKGIDSSLNNVYLSNEVQVYSGGICVGINQSIGVSYTIGKGFSVDGSLAYGALSWSPKRSVITQEVNNGNDMLASLPRSSKEFIYKEDMYSPWPAVNSDSPGVLQKFYFPLSSLGMKIGLRWSLDKNGRNSNLNAE